MPIGRARRVTAQNFEAQAKASDSSPVAEHKMTKIVRGALKLLRRGAAVMAHALEEWRTGLISVTRHICKSVARVRPGGAAPAAAGVPQVTGAGVKFNA
jgi:hypothetical protein